MRKKIFIISFLFFAQNSPAAEMHHGDDHSQIFHAFTAEIEAGAARDNRAKAFEINGWIGGDYNRLWLKSEQKTFEKNDKESEIQALYSRNIAPFWDAQIGIRHDFRTENSSDQISYLTISLEGLAPYMFETNAQIFLSDEGDYSARFQGEIDIFLTQKLITQPYLEAEFFAQDVTKLEKESGLTEIETGIVTRYEITRKFAPYLALRYEKKTFDTANLAKSHGEKTDNFITSVGLRFRF